MAKAPMESLSSGMPASLRGRFVTLGRDQASSCSFRSAQSTEGRNAKFFKELGLFSLKKKIEDTVNRAEMVATVAMELEEERRIKREDTLRECNLWNEDINTSVESLTAFADAIKLVKELKDVLHKAEEAKLITQLAEMDIINHHLFKQAYMTSLDVNKFLDRYEMSRLLISPYDKEGACMIIKSGMEGTTFEMWSEKLMHMYKRWAVKHGCNATVVDTFPSLRGDMKSATIEFEKEYMYGYLSGEKGIHKMIRSSLDGSTIRETWSASIDVIPLFLEKMVDFHIDDTDMEILSPSLAETCRSKNAIGIRHIPSNIVVECSGERSQFANKMKALNRLKAKLLVMKMEESSEASIVNNGSALKEDNCDTRRTQENIDPTLQYLEMGDNELLQGRQQDLAPSFSYEAAMEALSSLITQRKRGDGSKRTERFDLMSRYLQALDLEHRIGGLQIIHIAGTKGKGSTCAFSEAILRECGLQTGLFTSPHLMDVRERYRINGSDISREKFLLHFWECWHQLKEKSVKDLPMPSLFQFLTLLAFKIFLSEKVDVAILEVGLGGRFDSTNVVKEPVVTGITSLGMDHMEILGDTIEKIAFEKAGIFKPHVPAFTVRQCPEAMSALHDRASKLMIPLEMAPPLCSKTLNGLHLGLAGDHQFTNAGLAVALCRCWLRRTGHLNSFLNDNWDANLPQPFLRGLTTAHLSGRAQIVHDELKYSSEKPEVKDNSGDLIFYLDGAHSPESMEVCARWFSDVTRDVHSYHEGQVEETDCQKNLKNESCYNVERVSKKFLLFNCMEVRDPNLLFPPLINTCASRGVHFTKAFFVPSMSTYHKVDSGKSTISSDISQDVSWQSNLQRAWEKIIYGKRDATVDSCLNSDKSTKLPSLGLFFGDPSQKWDQANQKFTNSTVIPSLPLTIKLLRDCARENPTLRLQVLVTGSLHLVGDVLRLLKR